MKRTTTILYQNFEYDLISQKISELKRNQLPNNEISDFVANYFSNFIKPHHILGKASFTQNNDGWLEIKEFNCPSNILFTSPYLITELPREMMFNLDKWIIYFTKFIQPIFEGVNHFCNTAVIGSKYNVAYQTVNEYQNQLLTKETPKLHHKQENRL